jgi:hypothetical protein
MSAGIGFGSLCQEVLKQNNPGNYGLVNKDLLSPHVIQFMVMARTFPE